MKEQRDRQINIGLENLLKFMEFKDKQEDELYS
jgi:hypothetical protein